MSSTNGRNVSDAKGDMPTKQYRSDMEPGRWPEAFGAKQCVLPLHGPQVGREVPSGEECVLVDDVTSCRAKLSKLVSS